MRILLDTHILIWALTEPEKLRDDVRFQLEAGGADIAFSAASIWEIAIKSQVQRGDFPLEAGGMLQAATAAGFEELPVSAATAAMVARLPLHHRDPFDRLIVAQAITEPARLLTVDARLPQYSELVVRV